MIPNISFDINREIRLFSEHRVLKMITNGSFDINRAIRLFGEDRVLKMLYGEHINQHKFVNNIDKNNLILNYIYFLVVIL